jgi:hydroxymethylpyrimidine pyrophosphatase-like HAD family hydrolase/8-oxo-dGTP pyrophosphatase MutT (NUDIX family)
VIEKIAAVIIRGGLLLLCRKRGTDIFISPGGKREAGEGDREALSRELWEETGLTLRSADFFGTFTAAPALDGGPQVAITVYLVEADGLARPSGEIDELAWIDSGFAEDGIAIGSVFRDEVIPRLIAEEKIRLRGRPGPGIGRSRDKLVVADLDGTLAFAEGGLGPRVRAALSDLAANEDVRLVIATSRAPRGVRALLGPMADKLDLLCCNGSLHVTCGEVKSRLALPREEAAKLVDVLIAAGADFWLDYGERFVVSRPEAAPWMDYSDREVLIEGCRPSCEEIIKLSVIDWPLWQGLVAQAVGEGCVVCLHEDGTADITAVQGSKEQALVRWVGDRTYPLVAFGNDLNDQLLLAIADQAFVVGSGIPGLHRAGHVARIDPNDEAVSSALRAQLGGCEPGYC